MRCVVGVDCGGTKCEVLVASDAGEALGWGRCDVRAAGSGRSLAGSGRSLASVRSALREALKGLACDEVRVVAVASRKARPVFRAVISPKPSVTYLTETPGFFALAGATSGLIALAGTGAFVYGRDRAGRHLVLDGLGPLLGDHGGAFQIGLAALRVAARADWHARHRTSLAPALAAALELDPKKPVSAALREFMFVLPDRGVVADLARVVFAEARAGDAVAARLVRNAADALADTVRDAVDRLEMTAEPYPLIGAGGVIRHGPGYWERLCERVAAFAPRLQPVRLNEPPVVGIVLHELLKGRNGDGAALRRRLSRSLGRLRESRGAEPAEASQT